MEIIGIILTAIFGLIGTFGIIMPILSNILDIRDKFARNANKAIAMFHLSGINALQFRQSMTSLHAIRDYYTANILNRNNENCVVITRITLQLLCKGIDMKERIKLKCKLLLCRIQILWIKICYKISTMRFWICEYYPIRFRHKRNLRKRIKRNRCNELDRISKWWELGCPKII